MSVGQPVTHRDVDALVDVIINQVGKEIVLALPLGLGKANNIANALFARAAADPSISLKIFTALTLEAPRPSGDMERRFMGPIVDRLFGGYPPLAYAQAMRAGRMPANIEVNEFFLLAGRWLGSPLMQQSYIAANYTHALRYILDRKVNVVAQLVARDDGEHFNVSCNTDITLDLLKARAEGKADFMFVGEVNSELPPMPGEAVLPSSAFAHILDGYDFPLFGPPKEPIGLTDYAIGLHVAGIVPDGGTLQIGIGSMGDAVAKGLILRHRENDAYRAATSRLSRTSDADFRHSAPFGIGLYGASEMLVDSFLDLINAGVLKREVDGIVLHAGFFLGPRAFYKALREMPAADLAKIHMSPISFVNELYGDEDRKRRHRVGARFVNSTMMATLLGSVISDGLEDGRVVSGVGGQYNFVAQAFALDDARSIITLRSTRESGGETLSNIRWNYGYTTLPRHLRDIIVTEYGVADLRGKTDRDTIVEMLGVTDARFQDALLAEAKKSGKIEKEFEIPAIFRNNTPAHVTAALAPLRDANLIPPFPFGTDFTEIEQRLMPALQILQAASKSPTQLAILFVRGLRNSTHSEADKDCLARMGLDQPTSLGARAQAALLRGALSRARPQQ